MTFLDFFAGIGGFRRGMELAGHKCIGFCEWDKYATASYTSMHLITEAQREYLSTLPLKKRQKEILKEEYRNGEWYASDIRDVHSGAVPRADCWCFGAPCQDFSVAGKRAGLDGDRSSLVREVFRVLREMREEDRPEWLIYENVKGMLSSNRGFDYLAILLEMDELGYDIEWQLFNSKYYVPQNRERVYTVGHLRTHGRRKIFPIQRTDGEDCAAVRQIGQLYGTEKEPNPSGGRVYDSNGIMRTLGAGRGMSEPYCTVPFGIDYNIGGQERDIANTIMARYNCGVVNFRQAGTAVAIPVLTPDRPVKRQNGRRFKNDGEPSFTLTAQDRHGVAVEMIPVGGMYTNVSPNYNRGIQNGIFRTLKADSHPAGVAYEMTVDLKAPSSKTRRGMLKKGYVGALDHDCNQGVFVPISDELTVYAVWYEKYGCYIAIRKLTPKECFRLQGWTDDYFEKAQFVNSDAQLYKQAGNGVTVNVVYVIGQAIRRISRKDSYASKDL